MAEVGGAGAGPRPSPGIVGQLPPEMQQMVGAFLKPEELVRAGGVNQVMRTVFNSPAMWLQLANKIGLTIRDQANPRPEIEAYYKHANESLCKHLKLEMPKGNVFEQNAALRDYLKDGPLIFSENLANADTADPNKVPDIVLKIWIQCDNHVLNYSQRNGFNKLLYQRLLDLGARLDIREIYLMPATESLEALKWLVEEKNILSLSEEWRQWALNRALYTAVLNKKPEIARYLCEKGAKPRKDGVDKAAEYDEALADYLRDRLPPENRGAG